MEELSIYLAGSIKRTSEDVGYFWTDKEKNELAKHLHDYKLFLLDPAVRTDNLAEQKSVFGRDMTQVFCADFVLVDAREKRGIGVGAEMLWAKMNHVPVIILAPQNSYYNREDEMVLDQCIVSFVHPFIEGLADVIVDNIEEAATAMKSILDGNIAIKGPDYIYETMDYYKQQQFTEDTPMMDLVQQSAKLKQRFCSFLPE